MPRVEQLGHDDGEEGESLEELKDRWRERSGKNEDGQAMSIPASCLGNC